MRGVSGAFVNIVHDGFGGSRVYDAPNGVGADGAILAHGDVEDADVLADAGATFIDTGAFVGPAHGAAEVHAGHLASTGRVYLF